MEREAELAEAAYNDNAAAVSYVDEEEARAYHAEHDEQVYADQQEYDQYEKYHSEEYDGVEQHNWNDGEVIENDQQVQYEHEDDGVSHTTPIYKEETKVQQAAVVNDVAESTAVEQPIEIEDESNGVTNSGDDVQFNRMSSAKRMHEMLESARQSRSDLQYEDYYDSEEEEEEEEVDVEREEDVEHGNEQQESTSPVPRRLASGGNGGGSDLSVNVAFEPNVDEEYDTATDLMSGTSHKVSDYTTSAPQSPTSWDEGHGGVDTATPAHRMYAPPATRHQLY